MMQLRQLGDGGRGSELDGSGWWGEGRRVGVMGWVWLVCLLGTVCSMQMLVFDAGGVLGQGGIRTLLAAKPHAVHPSGILRRCERWLARWSLLAAH